MAKETVMYEHFKDINSLVRTINSRSENEVFANRELTSHAIAGSRDSFFKSASYEESIELLRGGYREPLEQIKKGIKLVEANGGYYEKRRNVNDVVGFLPHVPNYIIGLPQTMINQIRIPEKQKTINLVYGFSALGNVKANDLIKGGVMFLSLVNHLEKSGFRIKIDLLRCTTSSERHAIAYTVNVKEYSQPLNLLKLCYPLVHPSMLRRTSFRWCETLPNLKDYGYQGGYGGSLIARMDFNHQKEKDFLKRNRILKENQFYCNVYQAKSANSVEEMIKIVGLQ